MNVAFGPWAPDLGPFSTSTIDTVLNMTPLANGWGPMAKLVAVGNALGDTVVGGWQVRRSDGTFSFFVGTTTKLYKYNTATENYDDISGPSAPYNVPEGDRWQAVQFGPYFIVVNLNNPPQYIDIDSGVAFADLPGSPSNARYIWAAGDFVVLGYLKDGSNEFPQDIRWCALNDVTYWASDRVRGSDRQTLPDGDEIMGGFAFPGGARIIQRSAKRAMYFTGGQFIFEIRVLDASRGAIAPLAITPLSSDDYIFLREDGWYRGDGNQPIGAQRVDATFLRDVDLDSLDLVQGGIDPYNKAAMFSYRAADGSRKIIAYDWQLDQWYPSNAAIISLVSTVTPGLNLEAADGFPDDVDTPGAPSLDSRIYKGGKPIIGGFDANGQFYTFGGDPMSGTIETATLQPVPDGRASVLGARVIGDPGSGTTIEAGTAALPDDAITFGGTVTRSSRTGTYPLRSDNYFHRLRVTTADGDTRFTHIHALSVDVPSGSQV